MVLMDLLMPNMDGLTAIGAIKQTSPGIEIIAVTSFIEEEKVTAALEAGASGYLLKDADADEVGGRHPRGARGRGPPRSRPSPGCWPSGCGRARKPRRSSR